MTSSEESEDRQWQLLYEWAEWPVAVLSSGDLVVSADAGTQGATRVHQDLAESVDMICGQ